MAQSAKVSKRAKHGTKSTRSKVPQGFKVLIEDQAPAVMDEAAGEGGDEEGEAPQPTAKGRKRAKARAKGTKRRNGASDEVTEDLVVAAVPVDEEEEGAKEEVVDEERGRLSNNDMD